METIDKKLVSHKIHQNDNNSITFALVHSTVSQINSWYGIKGKPGNR